MKKFTLEVGAKNNLLPVTEEELKASIFSLLKTLQILFDSTQGIGECDVSCGVIDWSGTPDEIAFVEKSTPWSYLKPLWLYAEKGELAPLPEHVHLSDAVGDLIKWVSAIEPISMHSGENTHTPILKVLIKFFARMKLDFNLHLGEGGEVPVFKELEDGCSWIEYGCLPQVDCTYLSVVEMALLAGVSNIRTVRNAQYDKDTPLHFFKEGKKVLVKREVARGWLALRRGYVPTKMTGTKQVLH